MIYKHEYISEFDITHALQTLRPGAVWSLVGDQYKDIEWHDKEQTKPTEEEVNDEIARLQAEYDSKEYKRLRVAEYPSIEDQLDILYHQGYDGWKTKIEEIKNKFKKS
jgi:hypothetical protein